MTVYGIVMYRGQQEAVIEAERLTQSVAEALADQLTRAMQTVDIVMLDQAERSGQGLDTIPGQRTSLLRDVSQLRALVVTDGNGLITHSTVEGLVGQSLGDREWFRVLRLSGQTVRLGAPEAGRLAGGQERGRSPTTPTGVRFWPTSAPSKGLGPASLR